MAVSCIYVWHTDPLMCVYVRYQSTAVASSRPIGLQNFARRLRLLDRCTIATDYLRKSFRRLQNRRIDNTHVITYRTLTVFRCVNVTHAFISGTGLMSKRKRAFEKFELSKIVENKVEIFIQSEQNRKNQTRSTFDEFKFNYQ